MKCHICNSESIKKIVIKKMQAYKCLNCDIEFIWPQPSQEEINNIYQNDYYKSWGINDDSNEKSRLMKIATFNRYVDFIKKYKNTGRLLDIGCAFGYLLETVEDRGFDVYGVEVSKSSSNIAKDKFGDKIFNKQLEEVKFRDEYFDVITMFDLIEHIPRPQKFLKEIERILHKDGIIAIITPDTDSFSKNVLGFKNWFHYKPEHLFYYNKKSLNNLFNKFDFKIVVKKRGIKAITLSYLISQFNIFYNLFFTPLMNIIYRLSPNFIKNKHFYISGGEMFVIFKKYEK